MGSIITLSIVQSALELGFIYALVALALFISFSILNIADRQRTDALRWDVQCALQSHWRDIRYSGFWRRWLPVCVQVL